MVNLAGSGSLMSKMGCAARSYGKSSDINNVEHNTLLTQPV